MISSSALVRSGPPTRNTIKRPVCLLASRLVCHSHARRFAHQDMAPALDERDLCLLSSCFGSGILDRAKACHTHNVPVVHSPRYVLRYPFFHHNKRFIQHDGFFGTRLGQRVAPFISRAAFESNNLYFDTIHIVANGPKQPDELSVWMSTSQKQRMLYCIKPAAPKVSDMQFGPLAIVVVRQYQVAKESCPRGMINTANERAERPYHRSMIKTAIVLKICGTYWQAPIFKLAYDSGIYWWSIATGRLRELSLIGLLFRLPSPASCTAACLLSGEAQVACWPALYSENRVDPSFQQRRAEWRGKAENSGKQGPQRRFDFIDKKPPMSQCR